MMFNTVIFYLVINVGIVVKIMIKIFLVCFGNFIFVIINLREILILL